MLCAVINTILLQIWAIERPSSEARLTHNFIKIGHYNAYTEGIIPLLMPSRSLVPRHFILLYCIFRVGTIDW